LAVEEGLLSPLTVGFEEASCFIIDKAVPSEDATSLLFLLFGLFFLKQLF
jgi:hypothetical protein